MEKIKVGVIGMGFIGGCHIDAIRRIGFADLVAVADANYELAKKKAIENHIPKYFGTVEELLADDEINVVHNCTPNNLHMEINEKVIKAGKHVFSEKPLGRTSDESARMLELLKQYKHIVNGVNFNYRMNPLVQDMKNRIKKGDIGTPKLIHGSFLQDWLLYETDYNWRLEPEISGPSRSIADIGSHWMDSVQTLVGAKITEVCADLETVLPIRKKPKSQVETFSTNTNVEYENREINTEDYGAVLFKMDNGIRGVYYVSQVSAGRKCYLNFEINGTKASMQWNQETPDRMWMGFRDDNNCEIMRNPGLMTEKAREYTSLPAGHPEGWNDALKGNIYSFYKYIAESKVIGQDPCDFATFEEAHYIMLLTDAILKSNETRQWVKVGS